MEDDNLASFVTVLFPMSIDVNIAFFPHITTSDRNKGRDATNRMWSPDAPSYGKIKQLLGELWQM